jgi:hypothetical protein
MTYDRSYCLSLDSYRQTFWLSVVLTQLICGTTYQEYFKPLIHGGRGFILPANNNPQAISERLVPRVGLHPVPKTPSLVF